MWRQDEQWQYLAWRGSSARGTLTVNLCLLQRHSDSITTASDSASCVDIAHLVWLLVLEAWVGCEKLKTEKFSDVNSLCPHWGPKLARLTSTFSQWHPRMRPQEEIILRPNDLPHAVKHGLYLSRQPCSFEVLLIIFGGRSPDSTSSTSAFASLEDLASPSTFCPSALWTTTSVSIVLWMPHGSTCSD